MDRNGTGPKMSVEIHVSPVQIALLLLYLVGLSLSSSCHPAWAGQADFAQGDGEPQNLSGNSTREPGSTHFLKALLDPDTEGSNSHHGPLLLQGQSFFQLLRLSMRPWMTPLLQKGEFELQSTATWVNLWGWKPSRYLVDGEVLRLSVALCYGLSRTMQLRLEVPCTYRTGGIMDSSIEGFHDTFGYVQAYRDAFPRNRFRVTFYPPGGGESRLNSEDTGFSLSDLTLSLHWDLFQGTRYLPAVMVAQSLKVPTGENEGGGVDGGITLYLTKRVWRLYGYFGFQYTRCSKGEILGIPMNPDQGSFLICLEYPFTERFSLLLQELIHTGVAKDFYAFSESTHELALGFKYEFRKGALLEFCLIENLFNYDNSPDFGCHAGLSYRFGS